MGIKWYHVVGEVVTDIEAFDVTILGEFIEEVFIEFFEVVLNLARVDGVPLWVHAGGDHVGSLVHVGEQDGWADAGFRVEPRASIAVSACSDFEVEWAIHSVFLCSEY